MISKQLNIDDYVFIISGLYAGKKGLVIEIDPSGISVLTLEHKEVICSPAELSHVVLKEPLVIKVCKPKRPFTRTGCGVRLPADAFYKHRGTRDGYDTICKACRRAARRERGQDRRDQQKRQVTVRQGLRAGRVDEILRLLDRLVASEADSDGQNRTVGRIKQICAKLKGEKHA